MEHGAQRDPASERRLFRGRLRPRANLGTVRPNRPSGFTAATVAVLALRVPVCKMRGRRVTDIECLESNQTADGVSVIPETGAHRRMNRQKRNLLSPYRCDACKTSF